MLHRFFPFIGYFIIIISAVVLSILPDIYHIRQTPVGTTFPIIHNYSHDYFSYLSEMKTGYDRQWLVSYRATSEHFPPVFIYTFYVILGHLSRLSGLSIPIVYFVSRVFFGTTVLVVVLILIKKIFRSNLDRLTALFLVAFSTGFWKLSIEQNSYHVTQFLSFWSHFDPINRTTFLPHHIFSITMGLASIILLAGAIKEKRYKKAFLAGLLGFTGGIVYHGTMTNIAAAWGILLSILFILGIIKRSFISIKYTVGPIFLFALLTSFSLLYIVSLTHSTWPWTLSSNLASKFIFTIPFWEYIGMLGPTLILTLIGIPKIIKEKTILPHFLLCWVLFPFIGIFFLVRFLYRWGNMPYMEATSYIPLGILAVYGIHLLTDWMGKWKKAAYGTIMLALTLYFLPPLISSFNNDLHLYSPYLYTDYIPNSVLKGFSYLDSFTPQGSTVLAGGFTGAPLIAYTHNYTVYGDDINTYRSEKKIADVLTFFSQKDSKEGKKVLDKYGVKYVFFAYDTDPPKDSYVKELPLTEVYRSGRIVIYKVN